MRIRALHALLLLAGPVIALSWTYPSVVAAEEFEKSTSYYEDDAWYDVSEWLDGNDYNPTDEVAGNWDDESYDWSAVESDQDNDSNSGYGYDKSNSNDDWYYDYDANNSYSNYDGLGNKGTYDYTYNYYDYDNDGYYDALISHQDTNGDGSYDKYELYSFNTSRNASDQEGKAGKQQPQGSSKQVQVTGKIESSKKVMVRNGGERLVAQVASDQGKTFIVDLGRADQFGNQKQQGRQAAQSSQQDHQRLQQGEQITVSGPMIKVGDKQVVVAQTVKRGNKEQQINRSARTINGKITKMKTAKVRGEEHQMAILNLDSDKRVLIDLGAADKLTSDLAEGDQVAVSGTAVKIKDRIVMLADSITKNGEKTTINRAAMKDKSKSGS